MKKLYLFAFIFLNVTCAWAASKIDLSLNVGPSISQGGNIQKLGTPNISTGLGVNYYITPMHGIGFSYNNEHTFHEVGNAYVTTYDLHYVFRYIYHRFHFLVEPGIGTQSIYDKNSDPFWTYDSKFLSSSLMVNYKLIARYMIKEWESENGRMGTAIFCGLGILNTFSFNDSLRGEKIDGNRLAGIFQLGISW